MLFIAQNHCDDTAYTYIALNGMMCEAIDKQYAPVDWQFWYTNIELNILKVRLEKLCSVRIASNVLRLCLICKEGKTAHDNKTLFTLKLRELLLKQPPIIYENNQINDKPILFVHIFTFFWCVHHNVVHHNEAIIYIFVLGETFVVFS